MTAQRDRSSVRRSVNLLKKLLIVLVTCWLCLRLAYPRMYTGFHPYDDEGMNLMTLHQLSLGHPLYDQTFSIYGPMAFLPKLALLRITGLTLTHDVGRAVSLVILMISSALAGITLWRLGRSVAWFAVGMTASCLILLAIQNEPNHPQDLCSLWLAIIMVAAAFDRGGSVSTMIFFGAGAAALLLTKINLGVFCVAAIGTALVLQFATSRLRNVLLGACVIALIALPWALMHRSAWPPWVLCFCAEIILSTLACVVVAANNKSTVMAPRRLALFNGAVFVGVVFLATLVIVAVTLLDGTSISRLVQGTITLPMRVANSFSAPIALGPATAARAAGFALIAALVAWRWRRKPMALAPWPMMRGIVRLVAGSAALILACRFSHATLFAWLPPLLWLFVLPGCGGPAPQLARTVLPLLAALELMWAYPVAGSQLPMSLFVLIVVMSATLADGISDLSTLTRNGEIAATIRRLTAAAVATAMLSFTAISGWAAWAKYQRLESLQLPGSTLIHLPHEQARELESTVAALLENCDVFFTVPGSISFHFWTEIPPPTSVNMTNWMYALDDEQQQAIIAVLQRSNRAGVLWNSETLAFWDRDLASPPRGPLMDYIKSHFRAEIKFPNRILMKK